MRFKILVVGSFVSDMFEPKPVRIDMRKLARAIGNNIVGKDSVLVTTLGGGVDPVVANGAFEATKAKLLDPLDYLHLYPAAGDPEYDLPGLRITLTLTSERWTELRTEMVMAAHAIIAVGGGWGTLDIYEKARLQGKPVVPISISGGVSHEIWERINANFTAPLEKSDMPDFMKLNAMTDELKLADHSVSLALRLAKRVSQTHEIGIEESEKYIFVIMSFDKSLIDTYDAIKRVVSNVLPGFHCERVDDIQDDFRITDKILECIGRSSLVITDLTGERPNVYYELGFARGLQRRLIHIARHGTTLHFDVEDFNTIFYENIRELEAKLETRLRSVFS